MFSHVHVVSDPDVVRWTRPAHEMLRTQGAHSTSAIVGDVFRSRGGVRSPAAVQWRGTAIRQLHNRHTHGGRHAEEYGPLVVIRNLELNTWRKQGERLRRLEKTLGIILFRSCICRRNDATLCVWCLCVWAFASSVAVLTRLLCKLAFVNAVNVYSTNFAFLVHQRVCLHFFLMCFIFCV